MIGLSQLGLDTTPLVFGGAWATIAFFDLLIAGNTVVKKFHGDFVLIVGTAGITVHLINQAGSSLFSGALGFLGMYTLLELFKRIFLERIDEPE